MKSKIPKNSFFGSFAVVSVFLQWFLFPAQRRPAAGQCDQDSSLTLYHLIIKSAVLFSAVAFA